MKPPVLFISHKHADREIAEVVARFMEERTASQVKIHLSSSPDFQGPRFGSALNAQLRQALGATEVLLLIYTSSDQDWSYCMWECGLASHPQSANTTVIVLQCGPDVPTPFRDVVRANARSADDMKRLVDQLFRGPTIFPSAMGALAPNLKDDLVQRFADDLHARLKTVLPENEEAQVEQWQAWPYLRVELRRSVLDPLEHTPSAERASRARKVVGDEAVVVRSDARAAHLFGRQSLANRLPFGELLRAWTDKYSDANAAWFDSCCEQIAVCAQRGFPVVSWTAMREVDGDSAYTPVVTRVQRFAFAATVQFDLYFLNLSDPRAVAVTARMVPIADVFHKRAGLTDVNALRLRDLVKELNQQGRNRLPVLGQGGEPLYILHRSTIERFLVAALLRDEKPSGDLTLSDLLADPEIRPVVDHSFVVVKPQSTLAEAKAAMATKPGCSDVFVTTGGTVQGAVEGLLTNVDIARSS